MAKQTINTRQMRNTILKGDQHGIQRYARFLAICKQHGFIEGNCLQWSTCSKTKKMDTFVKLLDRLVSHPTWQNPSWRRDNLQLTSAVDEEFETLTDIE